MTNYEGPYQSGQDHLPSKKHLERADALTEARFVREIVHAALRVWSLSYKQRESTKYFTKNQIYLLNSHDECGG